MTDEEKKIKAVVWDIGGVILTDPEAENLWQGKEESKKLRKDFGSNKLSIDDFVSKSAKLLNMNKEIFLSSYKKAYFSIKPIKETLKIYEKMRTNKYILSDTNSLHLNFLKENFPNIFKISKRNYFSPEIQMRKDSKEVFEYLSKDLSLAPKQILFIDNKKEIVNFAQSVGFKVIHFVNPIKLKNDLIKLGVK